jgi:hypothetical protein
MSALKLIQDAALRLALGTRNCVKSTLAINAGGAATVKTTGTGLIMVDGVYAAPAALAAQSFAVTHGLGGLAVGAGPAAYVQPASSTAYYLVCQNLAGGVAIVQGGYNGQVVTLPIGATFTSQGELPAVPAGFAPLGVVKITTSNAVTFTPGTTALDAAGLTTTYTDVAMLPTANP